MQDVCRKLREKRKELGYSIEQVVERTKLHPSVIKDLEDCNFENITGTYLKGFLKIYAAFLGVDISKEVDNLEVQKSPADKSSLIKKRKQRPDYFKISIEKIKKISSQTKKKIATLLIVLILAWSVLSLGRFIILKVKAFFRNRPKVEKIETPKNDEKAPVDTNQRQGLTASITAKKKCFLRVSVDNRLLFEGVLNKGAIESWKGTKEIEFKISDGSAIYLEVNGKPIPTLSSIRRPIKSLKITPSGISIDK